MASFIETIDNGVRALVYTKFQTAMGFTNQLNETAIWPKKVAQREVAEKLGKAVLGFANVWCESAKFAWNRQRTGVAKQGLGVAYTAADKKTVITYKAVPVDLQYNFWLWSFQDWSKLRTAMDAYIFWQQKNPKLLLNIDSVYPMNMDLHFGEVVDESDVEGKFDKGDVFVYRFPVMVDGWCVEASSDKPIHSIHLAIYNDVTPPILLAEDTIVFPVV